MGGRSQSRNPPGIRREKPEAPRPLTPHGLLNLTAFAKLYGYVRFFHPSDQAAAADWETIAVVGARKVENAASPAELIARLQGIFQPIAPAVRIFPTGARPRATAIRKGPETIRYEHHGVGLASAIPNNIYKTERRRKPAAGQFVPKPFEAELVPGVTASVPLTLYINSGGTLPHAPLPDSSAFYERTAADRVTRIGAVIIAWNVFQHFYPYFDVVKTDWRAELPKALQSAATDAGPAEFHNTLLRLAAALRDGHGNVIPPYAIPILSPPLTMDWIEGQLVVTRAQPDHSRGVAPGDRILKIDGKPVEQAAAELRALTSGATEQWIRYRIANQLSTCQTRKMTLEIEPFASPGTRRIVKLTCTPPLYKSVDTYTETRPETVTELELGIVYVDLDRLTDMHWKALIPRLRKAKGIVFDVRGYPGRPGIEALAHLTKSALRSARWCIASAKMPDQLNSHYTESGWDVQPKKPYFPAKRAFLTDGRAISYAETLIGIVEHYKLGEIVGGPTAGTNGNINPFKLPGGYTITWTGMKVLKHDGSQHHGIGVLPTVPVSRTRKGVAEGKDEILLRGLAVVKRRRTPSSRPRRAP